MTAKLDDLTLRTRLLDLIRAGHGRYEAAIAVGLSIDTFRRYFKANADFREQVEAAFDASSEPVIKMLRSEGLAGDVTAAKEYLRHAAPSPRSESQKVEVQHHHEIAVDPETLNSIEGLRARLAGRTPALPEVIDVEETNDDPTAQ